VYDVECAASCRLSLGVVLNVLRVAHGTAEELAFETKIPPAVISAALAEPVSGPRDLEPTEARETLIECRRRPKRRQCLGLLWVQKLPVDRIEAYCVVCGDVEAVISGWQDTMWSDGIMPPVPPLTDD
jgi:hypothetical protein